jgi:hypothetical protein
MKYEYGDINFTDDPDYDHDLRSFESDQDSDDSIDVDGYLAYILD